MAATRGRRVAVSRLHGNVLNATCQCVHPLRCGASDASDLLVARPARRCVWRIPLMRGPAASPFITSGLAGMNAEPGRITMS
jgi:hypothetical protein